MRERRFGLWAVPDTTLNVCRSTKRIPIDDFPLHALEVMRNLVADLDAARVAEKLHLLRADVAAYGQLVAAAESSGSPAPEYITVTAFDEEPPISAQVAAINLAREVELTPELADAFESVRRQLDELKQAVREESRPSTELN